MRLVITHNFHRIFNLLAPWSIRWLSVKTTTAKLYFSHQPGIGTLQPPCQNRYILREKHPMKALSLNSLILLHLYLILENRDVLFENRTCETVDHGLIWNLHSRRFNSWDCLQNVNFLDDVCCLHIIVYPWNHKL